MSVTKEKKDNLITVYKAAQSLGIKAEVLQYQIDAGNIDSVEGMVYESVCDKISEQQATYIGIKAFLQNHNSDRFESKYVKNRNKYIDFLEDNAYFGIEIVEPDNILFDLPEREDFYITREDAQMFEYKSEQFFEEFGLTEEEKVFCEKVASIFDLPIIGLDLMIGDGEYVLAEVNAFPGMPGRKMMDAYASVIDDFMEGQA